MAALEPTLPFDPPQAATQWLIDQRSRPRGRRRVCGSSVLMYATGSECFLKRLRVSGESLRKASALSVIPVL